MTKKGKKLMVNIKETSPFDGKDPIKGSTFKVIVNNPYQAKVIVRGKPSDKFLKAFESFVGVKIPTKSWDNASSDDYTVFWTSPDEWIVVGAKGKEADMIKGLEKALKGISSSVVNVSDYYLNMTLKGSDVVEVLEKFMVIDLHDSVFVDGSSTMAKLNKGIVHVHRIKKDEWNLLVRFSFAEYIYDLFDKASKDLG